MADAERSRARGRAGARRDRPAAPPARVLRAPGAGASERAGHVALGGQSADLVPLPGDVFVVHWRDPLYRQERSTRVTFEMGADGAAKALAMQIGRDAVRAVKSAPGENPGGVDEALRKP